MALDDADGSRGTGTGSLLKMEETTYRLGCCSTRTVHSNRFRSIGHRVSVGSTLTFVAEALHKARSLAALELSKLAMHQTKIAS